MIHYAFPLFADDREHNKTFNFQLVKIRVSCTHWYPWQWKLLHFQCPKDFHLPWSKAGQRKGLCLLAKLRTFEVKIQDIRGQHPLGDDGIVSSWWFNMIWQHHLHHCLVLWTVSAIILKLWLVDDQKAAHSTLYISGIECPLFFGNFHNPFAVNHGYGSVKHPMKCVSGL